MFESVEAPREPLVAQLELYRRQLDKVRGEINDLAAGMSEEQFNWRPPSGGWSVAECIAHLNVTNALYLAPIDAAIESARRRKRLSRGPFRHSWLGKWFIKSLDPPPTRRIRTPAKLMPERRDYRVGVVVPTFLTFQDQLLDRIVAANGVDLSRVKVRSQVVGFLRFSLGETFAILAAHERRHLWQAQQVTLAPAFPPSPAPADPPPA